MDTRTRSILTAAVSMATVLAAPAATAQSTDSEAAATGS